MSELVIKDFSIEMLDECAYLHSGNTDVARKYKKFNLDSFELKIEKKNEYDMYTDMTGYETITDANGNSKSGTDIRIDIRNLCNKLIWSAEGMMKRKPELFRNLPPINIYDFDKEWDSMMECAEETEKMQKEYNELKKKNKL